jgi:fructokinase
MGSIYTIGETVMDILFRDGEPVTAKPGGSMLNTSVTLGRLMVPVHFISEYGTDRIGEMINRFLCSNSVDTTYVRRYNDGKSALALAFLDEHHNADYSFYKIYPEKRLDVHLPSFTSDDIVLFGSYFGIAPEIRNSLLKILNRAKQNGAIIIYDPNFRKAHLDHLPNLLPFIHENIHFADIVKGSDEDFKNIFSTDTIHQTCKAFDCDSKVLIYTRGRDGSALCYDNRIIHTSAKAIEAVSTIGAGDNYNAGIAFSLFRRKIKRTDLPTVSDNIWEEVLKCGTDFATEVCMSYENYVSESFARNYTLKTD